MSRKNYKKRHKDPVLERQYRRLYVKPGLHYKHRQWEVDQDYIDRLEAMERHGTPEQVAEAREALDYLSKFLGEYYHNTGIPATPNPYNPALHNTDLLRRDCYNRTNRAQRDLFSIKGATGWLEHEQKQEFGAISEEELSIEALDAYYGYRRGELTEEQYELLTTLINEELQDSKIVINRKPKSGDV